MVEPILITGARGTLGRAFTRIAAQRGLAAMPMSRSDLDVTDARAVAAVLDRARPWAVVNAAGYGRIDDAEREPERCRREIAGGAAVLAEACSPRGIALLAFSSSQVFDGSKRAPYHEADAPAPLNAHGRAHAEAEVRVLAQHPRALLIRACTLFGPWDEGNVVTASLARIAAGETLAAADDLHISPTYLPDLVHEALDLLIDRAYGVWHLASASVVTFVELIRAAARIAGFDEQAAEGRPAAELGLAAARPSHAALASRRGSLLPPIESSLHRYAEERALHLRLEQERSP